MICEGLNYHFIERRASHNPHQGEPGAGYQPLGGGEQDHLCQVFFQLGRSPHLHQGPHQWSSNTPSQAELWTNESNRSEVVRPGWTLCLSCSQGSQDFLQDYGTWHFMLKKYVY